MIKLKDMGEFTSVPQIVSDIISGNLPALDQYLKQGWNIEKVIKIGLYTSLSPLDLALIMECFDSVKWLDEHGVNLNVKNNPSFLTAVRYCDKDIIKYLVENGATVESSDPNAPDAFMQAIYWKRYDNLKLIDELGHTVKQYGGPAFRHAVFDYGSWGQSAGLGIEAPKYEILDFFIKHGVDINYNKPDSIFSFDTTPLCVGVRHVDLDICKYLVEHGADVTIAEKGGMRPYIIALEKGDAAMADYFKALEPAEFHSLQNKLLELKSYKLPQLLLDFLQGDNLQFDFSDDFEVSFIKFLALVDTVPMKIKRKKLLRISKEMENYSHVYILWNPKEKCISYYDTEHEELCCIASVEDFLDNMADYIQKIINGDFN